MIVFDDHKRGFIRGEIEGIEDQLLEESKKKITDYIKEKTGLTPILSYMQNAELTAGYRITADDLQLDASLEHQFSMLRNSILGE